MRLSKRLQRHGQHVRAACELFLASSTLARAWWTCATSGCSCATISANSAWLAPKKEEEEEKKKQEVKEDEDDEGQVREESIFSFITSFQITRQNVINHPIHSSHFNFFFFFFFFFVC
jgi:hypothetical protein